MIKREDFYSALEHLRNCYNILIQFENVFGITIRDSKIGEMFDETLGSFCDLVFGKNYMNEDIMEALKNNEIEGIFEPEEGFNEDASNGIHSILPYEKYYEYFVEGKWDV